MNDVYEGSVIWFNNERGIGFIKWSMGGVDQKDMFVHFSDINMNGFRTLKKDQLVEFSIGQNNAGEPKATNVVVIQ